MLGTFAEFQSYAGLYRRPGVVYDVTGSDVRVARVVDDPDHFVFYPDKPTETAFLAAYPDAVKITAVY